MAAPSRRAKPGPLLPVLLERIPFEVLAQFRMEAPPEGEPPPPADPPKDPPDDDGTDWKAQARKWEARAKKAADEAKAATDLARQQTLTEHEKAIEAARKEAADNARAEVATTYAKRLVATELRAAAGGILADPADAAKFIDLEDLDLDKDGNLTPETAKAAVANLLKEKPYLGATPPPRNGTADGGARTPSGAPLDPRAADLAQIERDLTAGRR